MKIITTTLVSAAFFSSTALATLPVVAIHDSELTRTLETMPAVGATPTGAGTTGKQWWPNNWHYFVMPDSVKEALRSDGTAFQVVGDSNILSGVLTNADGTPKYPIVISLASEAIADAEIAQFTNYVASGGFLFIGSSAFTRNTNGTTRGDFALAKAMGMHMVNAGLTNWTANYYFNKQLAHPLTAHIPEGSLFWHMPLSSDQDPDPYPTHPPGVPNNPHLIWQVKASDAVAIAWGDNYPYLLVKKFGKGYFIYDAAMQPLLGVGGFSPVMYSYGIFRNAIQWAFASANLPVIKLSPWPYQYDAAVIFRHDMEALPYLFDSILPSAQFENAHGAKGDYYFCTGMLREDMPTTAPTTLSNLLVAVSLGATISPHNGGLTNINPYVPALTPNDYDYWHWGPDDILDTTNVGFNGPVVLPAGYASTAAYAFASVSNSFLDVEGWGLNSSNTRTWSAPYFNSGRETSLQILQALNVKTAGEQKVCPFPSWTISVQTPDKRYSFVSLPTSDWYVGTAIAQAMENGHTSNSITALVDYYYNMGALINLYNHSSSDGRNEAGPLASYYVTYSLSKPRVWSANALGIYNWWLQRSNAQITASYATNGSQSSAIISIAGAVNTNSAVEIVIPATSFSGLQVLTNGTIAGTNSYRINGQVVKVLVGTSITNAVIKYTPVPYAQNKAYYTGSGVPLSVGVPGLLDNVTNPPGTYTAIPASGPAKGTLNFSSNGSFTYTPTNSFVGVDSFTYQISNGQTNSNIATVTITVTPTGDSFYDNMARPANSTSILPWQTALGTWTITNNYLSGTSATYLHGYAYIDNTNWTDYSVQAQIQFSTTNAWGGGLGGRLNAISGAHYAAWVYPEGSKRGFGTATLVLIKFDGWSTSWNVTPMAEVTLPPLGTNWHTLSLTFQSTNISVDFDGVQEISTSDTDTPYSSGGISLDLYSDTTPYSMAVDNVVVSASPPIVVNNDSYSLLKNTVLNVSAPGVLANDTGGNGSLTAILVSGPTNGMIVFNSDGTFSYTPTNNFVGSDSFTYQAVSGQSTSAAATVTLTVQAPTDCVASPSGLVGWWPGDGNANDYEGTNNGTLEGGAVATAPGVVGTAFLFDGTNGYVQIPDSPSLRPTNLTIETWVLFNSLDSASDSRPGHQYMVFKQNTQNGNFEGYGLGKDRIAAVNPNGDFFYFNVSSSDGVTSAEVDSISTVTTGVWYHVVGVRGPDYIQLYINGQLEGTTSVNFPQDYGNYPMYFGTTGQSYWDGRLNGKLDEVSLYGRPLSSNEIAALYQAGNSGKCKTPTIVTQPQDQTGIFGGMAAFNVVADGSTPLSYQWQKGSVVLAGATNATLVLTNLQASDAAGYTVVATNVFGSVTSIVAQLTVTNVVIVTQPVSVATNAGSTVSFAVSVTGTASLNYQWVMNGTNILSDGGNIQGSQSPILTISNVLGSNDGMYAVAITSTNGGTTSSNADLLVVDPVITSQPAGVVTNAGNPVTFTVAAYGTQPLSYQWFKGVTPLTDGGNVSGSTTATLQLGSVSITDGAGYSVVVSNVFGSVTSSVALLTVNTSGSGTGGVLFADDFVRSTDPGPIAPWVEALGTWTVTGQQLEVSSVTAGALAEAYVAGNWSNCMVQGEVQFPAGSYGGGLGGCVNTNDGSRYAVWIYPGSDTLSLVKFFDWQSWSYTPMQTVVLTNDVGTSWHSLQLIFEGNTILVNFDTNQVINVVDNGNSGIAPYLSGGISADVWASSPSSAMVVSNVVVIDLNATNNPPAITNQPAGLSVIVSNSASFTVGVTGDAPLNYQWWFNGTNAVGLNTNVLTLNSVTAVNAGNYSVVITNGSGSVTSAPALLVVKYPPAITNQPAGLSVIVSNSASFTVGVTGDAPLNYQWWFNGTNAVGLNTNTLTLTNIQTTNAGSYSVVVTNNYGSVTSTPAALTVMVPPTISSQPQGLTLLAGATAGFTVTASGTPSPAYQWYFNATNAVGLNTNKLILTNIQATNAGVYSVLVTNLAGSVTSSNALLYVIAASPNLSARLDVDNNLINVTFTTQNGPTYYLQYEDSLTASNWQVLTNVTGTGGPMTLDIPVESSGIRYFRMLVQ